ncbi:MAG TPA: methyltransferase type 11 [Elusimicrobia bacterium]|nr:MAG: hypothetical protein A2278_06395 [Elusimicrobia bacterium RIFOXYA12_FULL_49_49]OGS09710.1 MAG: hypothetical protein A2204_02050 [Elusimicrobia bacterium RIFOXYA1_FULL_47_7]OGS10359.1 MAG: hypothetical protein A2386_04520 [Elusimicrobia bacterium RIFOXYB1_FULL_48_9]OGS16304.1 MAG: hypothetical protein A2251_01710 [Elusimicrobia bacterium RIFOXYA2_FULL_47_53]OGS25848.1 MAG: hypothetical protein A2339_03600 [Elusimicrobia bacterium RIFOXYB12_FULL_50_12]OGS31459.1 MAG: hypothetical protein
MTLENQINIRYGELAESSCCLSCGGAIDHAKAREGETCLDLGSGRGQDALKLAQEVGDKGLVYGIDLSDKMIAKAERTAQKLGISNVKFIRSNLENLPLESSSVDLVISNCTINHASDKQAVWREIYRVLRKGGRFVISDIYALREVPPEYKNDPAAVAECWAGASTREAYLKTLCASGFPEVSIIEESKPYDKGKITVASFTVSGIKDPKPVSCCCK